MPVLADALRTLKERERELRGMGVSHAAIFGSVARSHTRENSDLDIIIDLDQTHTIGIYEYSNIRLYIEHLFPGAVDVVNRKALKPLLQENILRDAVDAS